MVRRSFTLSLGLVVVASLALGFDPRAARAQPPDEPAPAAPAAPPATTAAIVHHTPVSVATAHEAFPITVDVDRPDLARSVVLIYRTPATGGQARELRFDRTDAGLVAEVPASEVVGPQLEYAIEIVALDGSRTPAFASRAQPFVVQVPDDVSDLRERAALARLGGRRSVIVASGEYVFFGQKNVTYSGGSELVRDEYWRTDASYTYRFLRTVAEFGIRFGVVRGSAPVLNATDPSQFNVGLNYGAPRLRLRLADWCNIEGEFLTSVTEVGFSLGGGGAVLFGDAYGTHLTLGVEGVEIFGVRTWSSLDVVAGRRLRLGVTVEVTNMPHASTAGVRLLLDARIDLGRGFGLALRGGYQARTFDLGGPGAGLGLSYAF